MIICLQEERKLFFRLSHSFFFLSHFFSTFSFSSLSAYQILLLSVSFPFLSFPTKMMSGVKKKYTFKIYKVIDWHLPRVKISVTSFYCYYCTGSNLVTAECFTPDLMVCQNQDLFWSRYLSLRSWARSGSCLSQSRQKPRIEFCLLLSIALWG